MHFRNRELSPSLGRWVRNDPIGFKAGSPNFLAAVGNNPINRLDSLGLKECTFAWYDGGDGEVFKLCALRSGCDANGDMRYIDPGSLIGRMRSIFPPLRLLPTRPHYFAGIDDGLRKGGCKCIRALYITDHGGPGDQQIGDEILDPEKIKELCKRLCPDADIFLRGCQTADFIEKGIGFPPMSKPGQVIWNLFRCCDKTRRVIGCKGCVWHHGGWYPDYPFGPKKFVCTVNCDGGWKEYQRGDFPP